MKPKEAATNLRVIVPTGDQEGGNGPVSTPHLPASPKGLHKAIPKMSDIPPLNWRKKTPTTPSKPRSAGILQGPRKELKKKTSAPDLGRRKFPTTSTDSPKSPIRPDSHGPDLRKKSSAPDLRRSRGDYTPGVGSCPPLPRHTGTPSLGGSDRKGNNAEQGPRFMATGEHPAASPSQFNQRPQIGAPKLPSIIGTAPSRLKPKTKVEVKRARESRSKQMTKVLRNPDFKVRCRSAVRNLNKMKLMRRIQGCARLIRASAQRKATNIENRPIYRLREMKRASVMLSLPKIQRLPSIKSIGDLVLVDQPNDQDSQERSVDIEIESNGSVYENCVESAEGPLTLAPAPGQTPPGTSDALAVNRRDNSRIRPSLLPYWDWLDILESSANPFSDDAGEGPVPTPETALDPTVNLSEDHSIRASLVPFRDWLVILDSHRNTLNLENPREPPHASPLEILSSYSTIDILRPPDINRSLHPSHPYLSIPQRSSVAGDRSSNIHSPSSHSSIAPSSTAGVMAASSPQDPFVDASAVEGEGLTQIESQVFAYHRGEPTQEPRARASPEESTPTAQTSRLNFPQKDYADHSSSQSARARADAGLSRIPRIPTQKRTRGLTSNAQRAAAITPEHHSSIPVSVYKRSAEGSETHETLDQRFSGGIRMIERPADLRRRIAVAPNSQLEPGSTPPVAEEPDSSSVSSFGCSTEPDELTTQRPTGLTGEHRIRPKTRTELLEKYGAQLKIASSAERILLGKDNDASERPTPNSPSAQDHGRRIMPMPRYDHTNLPRIQNDQSQLPREMSGSRLDENLASGGSREVPNFCRPQLPSDNHPRKNDFSGRELSMHRKPTSKPSFTGPHAEGENYGPENVPPVPRVSTMRKSESSKAIQSDEHTAPLGGTPVFYADMASRVDPFNLAAPLDSHPPRSSSKRVQPSSDVTLHGNQNEAPNDSAVMYKAGNVNIDDIAQGQEQHSHGGSGRRLPDSKSTRMFDSFRSIFSKSRSGAEKGTTGWELSGGNNTKRARDVSEGDQASKVKARWSKSSRSLRAQDVSTPMLLPSPASYSSIPAPRGPQDAHTPSFARPTQATRTRAAASAKQISVSQDARMHRIKVLSPSTGSPSRVARIQKRTNETAATTPNTWSDSERPNPPEKDTPVGGKLADSGRIGVDSVQEAIESLCANICANVMPTKRAKYLRLALALQQQLSDYKSVEKEARDLETLLTQKKGDKGLALHSLIQYLDQVRLQMDED